MAALEGLEGIPVYPCAFEAIHYEKTKSFYLQRNLLNGTDGRCNRVIFAQTSLPQRGSDIDGDAAGDNLGWSGALSFDGNTMAIGVTGNYESASDAGHVRNRVLHVNNLSAGKYINSTEVNGVKHMVSFMKED